MRNLDAFDRRLEADSGAPVAVAVSGGADSLLALIGTARWAARRGRPVLALSVDHGLQPESASWTARAGEAARALGCDFRALTWTGARPARSLAAAARGARHRLLADAAREAGARVIVTGHTGDDRLENAALGQGVLAEWSPSPVWPEGRGLALLRPLLDLRRAEIRAVLAAEGHSWIEDPANDNPLQPRVQARRRIAGGGILPPPFSPVIAEAALARLEDEVIVLPRQACVPRLLAMACLSLGGGEIPPRRDRAHRVSMRIAAGERFTASLAGARLVAEEEVMVAREAGEAARAGLEPITAPGIWDGRYWIGGEGEVRALAGQSRRLPPDEARRLAALPAAARPGLPVVERDGALTCPILAEDGLNPVEALWPGRFLTACGLYAHERDLRPWLR